MNSRMKRRDFLKLAASLPLGYAVSRLGSELQQKPQNILIVVFDAFSAYNISTYGYERQTTPNISRLLQKAIVYHNHYAGGNFTTPGTASLLTGVLPWTHRAFQPKGEVIDAFTSQNIFSMFPEHYRIAYTHNGWANILLNQMAGHIDELIQREKLLLSAFDSVVPTLFRHDEDIASVSWARAMKTEDDGFAYSLFLSRLSEELQARTLRSLKSVYPRGIPTSGADSGFLLETAMDHLVKRLNAIPKPFMGYFHFLPPHDPYNTHRDFVDAFRSDGYKPIEKPVDLFAKRVFKQLPEKRRQYDEYILYCDREFNRLFEFLESSGVLKDTWLVLTSDHGELNERGISGHSTDAMYEPVVRIPLVIFEPGRTSRLDVHERTSAIDIVSTLASIVTQKTPSWGEGHMIPPFGAPEEMNSRNIYVVRANYNDRLAPLTVASTVLVKESYKFHYYFGYSNVPGDGLVKLFDVQADPEEMTDLAQTKKSTADELLHELRTKLSEVDEPYR